MARAICVACLLMTTLTESAAGGDVRCGGYALYIGLKALGVDVGEYASFEKQLGGPTPNGYSLDQLARSAESYGMRTLGVKTTFENLALRENQLVCIALIDGKHFVNLADVTHQSVRVIDAPREYSVPTDTFMTQWDGTALLISPDPLLREEELPRPFPWKWLLVVLCSILIVYTGVLVVRGWRRCSA